MRERKDIRRPSVVENFHISIKGHENTFALCLLSCLSTTNVKNFRYFSKQETVFVVRILNQKGEILQIGYVLPMAEKRVHWERFGPFLLPMEAKYRHWEQSVKRYREAYKMEKGANPNGETPYPFNLKLNL